MTNADTINRLEELRAKEKEHLEGGYDVLASDVAQEIRDLINRDLAEMEGECVHEWGQVSFGNWICDKCKITCETVGHFPRKHFPDRLSDGAYILGLEEKLLREDYLICKLPNEQGFNVGLGKHHFKDKSLRHAIALAAIQRRKDGGG